MATKPPDMTDLTILAARFDDAEARGLLATGRLKRAEALVRRALEVITEPRTAALLLRILLARGDHDGALRCTGEYFPETSAILFAGIDVLRGKPADSAVLRPLLREAQGQAVFLRDFHFWAGLLAEALGEKATAARELTVYVKSSRDHDTWEYEEARKRLAAVQGKRFRRSRKYVQPPEVIEDGPVVGVVVEADLAVDFDGVCAAALAAALESAKAAGRACVRTDDLAAVLIENDAVLEEFQWNRADALKMLRKARGEEVARNEFSEAVWRALSAARWLARALDPEQVQVAGEDLLAALVVCPRGRAHVLGHLLTEQTSFFDDLYLAGFQIPRVQARFFEQYLEQDPEEPVVRALALGAACKGWRQPQKSRHVTWMVKNHPRSPMVGRGFCSMEERGAAEEAYVQALVAWRKHILVAPDDRRLLWNGGHFFLLVDKVLSEALLERGRSLQPRSPTWVKALASLHEVHRNGSSRHREAAVKMAVKAANLVSRTVSIPAANEPGTSEFQEALATLSECTQILMTAQAWSEVALLVPRLLALSEADSEGLGVHRAHLALGHLALNEGDVARTAHELRMSAQTDGGAVLWSYGPNMSLAQRLVALGHRAPVLEYLTDCGRFWRDGKDRLDAWRRDIEAGRVPDFGGNLVY